MPVIISYSGGQRAAEVCEDANRWSWDGFSLKLYGPGGPTAREKPIAEISSSSVARLEHADRPLRRYKGTDDPIHKD
jgi:hypothetical protein